jgi:hypothetical protein
MIWNIISLASSLPVICITITEPTPEDRTARANEQIDRYGIIVQWFDGHRQPRIYYSEDADLLDIPLASAMNLSTFCRIVKMKKRLMEG